MPDINPADLSRSMTIPTPIISTKTFGLSKTFKASQIIPVRIDLEPIYTALRAAVSGEQWAVYKEATTQFFIGRLNQVEFSERIDPIITSHNGEKEHLHNQLLAAIYGNVTREMPDQGLAPWVSANDKPSNAPGSKPLTGDAAERRLKGEVMQLPGRDRRRIKDLAHNEHDPYDNFASVLTEHHRAKGTKPAGEAPPGPGGLNGMNFDSEIRKKYTQTLAVESGEFPDMNNIEGRMLPCCYEAGLVSGHAQDAPQYMSTAIDTFMKEMLSTLFGRTRCNGPGDSGSSGFGSAAAWVQTSRYRKQLAKEEDGAMRGEVQRDKGGLLPAESKAASERGPLAMSDLRLALEMGDSYVSHFPIVAKTVINTYRDGEQEDWNAYTYLEEDTGGVPEIRDQPRIHVDGKLPELHVNGIDEMDLDDDEDDYWEGGADDGLGFIDGVLDTCLAVG